MVKELTSGHQHQGVDVALVWLGIEEFPANQPGTGQGLVPLGAPGTVDAC